VIKAVIFDCFGVLTTDRWLEYCATLPPGEIVSSAKKLNHRYDSNKMSLDDFLDQMGRLTGKDRQPLKDIFTNPEGTKNVPLIEYIRTLKPNYKLGILSNIATNWPREVLLTDDEQKLFDAMVFSFEIGATKPDPRTYEAILAKLDIKPEGSVFIDDQPHYCDGARAVGMQAIRYENFEQMKSELEKILAANGSGPNN
jgi:epoxide hydrolase-like predicted phosphatase